MARPPLPDVVAGRSALPAFREIERWAEAQVHEARREAAELVETARVEADTMLSAGERALADEVLEGEREALREVESRARDRVSRARSTLTAWTAEQEARMDQLVEQAVRRLTGA